MSPIPPEAPRRTPHEFTDDSARTEESRETASTQLPGGALEGSTGPPARIGPYRIDGVIGRGGMGEVYRAWDPRLERHVALKRILPERASPKARVRFWREARVLAALKHPGLVALHDIGEEGDALYLTMELITGEPLSVARGARFSLDAALSLMCELAEATGAAHAAGIVHRDIKPSNVLIEPSGAPRLIDFGLAHKGDEEELTSAGAQLGTWSWMAPEQIAGEPTSPRTDVHALAAILYTMLAGESPYQRETLEATAASILASARPSLRRLRPDLPVGVFSLLDLSFSRNPARRPTDGKAFANALKDIAQSEDIELSRTFIRAGVEAARSAIHQPSLGTGLERTRRPGRRFGTRAKIGIALLSSSLVLGFGWWSSREDIPSPGMDAEIPEQSEIAQYSTALPRLEIVRAPSAGALRARESLSQKSARAVAVLPFEDPDGSGIGGALAELLRLELPTIPRTQSVPYRELLGHTRGRADARALLRPRLGQPAIDAVLTGRVLRTTSGGNLVIEVNLETAEPFEAITTFSFETTLGDISASARSFVSSLAEELGAPVRSAPQPAVSLEALHHVLSADEALHHDEWRTFAASAEAAFLEAPTHPRVIFSKLRLALALDRVDNFRALLSPLLTRTDISPRDASYARILDAQYGSGRPEELPSLVERHLQQFPRDIEVKYIDLGLKFTATGTGKLKRAAEAAAALLGAMPHSPLAASRLVRALSWLGRFDEARHLLVSLGVTPEDRGMSSVFAELAMYEGNFDEAISGFERNVERDGDMTFYAANMHIAALMLASRCWEAYVEARKLLRPRASDEPVFGVDWTYFLSVNAAACDGSLDRAIDGLEKWHGFTGSESGHAYRGWLPAYRVLGAVIESDFANALLEDLVALESVEVTPAYWVIMDFSTDIAELEAMESIYRKHFYGQAERGTAASADYASRAVRGLEAKRAFLEGQTAKALSVFEALAREDGFEVVSEGSLFERTRWMSTLALHYQYAGMRDRAVESWQALLDLAYPRLLEMPATVRARQRLRALGVSVDGAP